MSNQRIESKRRISAVLVTLMLATMSISLASPIISANSSAKASPPGVGLTNLTVMNTTYLNGSHSYDDVSIICGTGGMQTCGSIVATGDLILTVNTLSIASGGSLIALDSPTNTQGVGTSVTLASNFMGEGAGGAGHYGIGGDGGGLTAGQTNGGSSYGTGNETGSNGGDVSDSNGNLISLGGNGGGRIIVYADVIDIDGDVTAIGEPGEQGYRFNNGSGNGGSGAGGGSGGSIIMLSNELTVSSTATIEADGGDGGDGADGDCVGVCIGMYDGGNGGGGGSGGSIDLQANSASNLSISTAATISAAAGSAGQAGAPYGTGTAGSSGYAGATGSTNSGTWAGWSSNNSTGGGGNPPPPTTSCIGNGTSTAGIIQADILESNDVPTSATQASMLPLDCTDLSLHTTTDVDYFEIQMITGVTYYVNVTFTDAIEDIDVGWDTINGSFLSSGTSTSDNEQLSVLATQNITTYVDVYLFQSFGGVTNLNTYDISIETDNPGGGQSFELANVEINNETNATISYSGLAANTMYNYTTVMNQYMIGNTTISTTLAQGSFNATSSMYEYNVSFSPEMNESDVDIETILFDASGNFLDDDFDTYELDMVEVEVTSSTTGLIELTNLSTTTTYDMRWIIFDENLFLNDFLTSNSLESALNVSIIDESTDTFTSTTENRSYNITWAGPTTTSDHVFAAILSVNGTQVNLDTNENLTGLDDELFVPQLPSIVISSVSSSVTSTTNDVTIRGQDLVVGDSYDYKIKILDSGNATIAQSSLTSFTATYQGMSLGTWTYVTSSFQSYSGTYCALVELYEANGTQRIGDISCFNILFDDDGDSVANADDLCPNTPTGSLVNLDGCALSQIDTDNDGYNDSLDAFVNDSSQWSDQDGDGYGDNPTGNMSDAFPSDSTQWADQDGDGYGDNPNGSYSDAFPTDPTQWSDSDGDGYGDNASGNNPDLWPNDGTQWADQDGDGFGDNSSAANGDKFPTDATQWADQDGDGYGDNPTGTMPDAFPTDATQWADTDGDGYGDNPTGTDGDAFPSDSSQWADQDGDGYGDNQAGTEPDAFPTDSTQWADQDGDGYGDNQAGNNADAFPTDSTQWADQDGDGYGDNANGNTPDLCPNTPAGQVVDATGCSDTELDDDSDGVSNSNDVCPSTPAGESVNSNGCSDTELDDDLDGIKDAYDACPSTSLGLTVDASGCSESQKDGDGDGLSDDIDQCPSTPAGSPVDGYGCSSEQRDNDNDGVYDNVDLCGLTEAGASVDQDGCADAQKDDDGDSIKNDVDLCPGTEPISVIDINGCSDSQLDDDQDQIFNNVDSCPATPVGEMPNSDGCSATQLDDDMDTINNADDLCPMTEVNPSLDADGCVASQRDTDLDGVTDKDDDCPNTNSTSISDDDGCALEQLDSDGDGVNDLQDDFPLDALESKDTDGDGTPDRMDAYPGDATKTKAEVEDQGSGMWIWTAVAVLVLGLLAGLGMMKRNTQMVEKVSPFTQQVVQQGKEETQLLEEAPTERQEWEENGVKWSRSPEGTLYYYDAQSEQWIEYQQ